MKYVCLSKNVFIFTNAKSMNININNITNLIKTILDVSGIL